MLFGCRWVRQRVYLVNGEIDIGDFVLHPPAPQQLRSCLASDFYGHTAQQMCIFIAALCNRGPLYFCPVISIFYLSIYLSIHPSIHLPIHLFSSPNLSGRRLDVYHTLTHGVALVRIYNAGLKRAARGSLKIQDAKITQKFAICAPSHNFVGLYLRN